MSASDPHPGESGRIRILQRRLTRERAARAEAEAISERITSELYETVQELTRSTRVAELLSEVAASANEAATTGEAVTAALATVCAYTGWPLGHALVRSSRDPGLLRSLGTWHCDEPDRFAAFREISQAYGFAEGVGLPGRIWQTGAAVWAPNLAQERNFPRQRAAADCGLRAGFGIPVLIRRDTAAVLEFFSTETHPPDTRMLRLLTFVGAQLGRVMEREAAEERLRQQALYDGLTGLPNRTLLMDRLRHSLARGRRYGARVDLLFLDIDDFKTINDSQGHRAGDDVLAAISLRLIEAVRQTDSIGEPMVSTVARLGGDEFAIVLDDCPDPKVVADRISQRLCEPLRLDDTEVFVSVSIGTASGDVGTTPEDLLAAANVAMHEAKRTGKGMFVVFAPRMQTEARRRHSLGEELHRAITNEEFFLDYQPIVDLASERIIGAEALLRWAHPAGDAIGPGDFIARAEETGLIVPLGAWILRTACTQAALWRSQYSDFFVTVNVSARELRELDFAEGVRAALRDASLPAVGLWLEMTESILMERDDEGIAMLHDLRADGVHLAIDDFGTGYSSLAALQRLPVDLIKIDQSFVAPLPHDSEAGTIAWAVVGLGHTLGMPVLAEGVESSEQCAALRRFGCDQAQGFFFSRPLTPEQLGAKLMAQVHGQGSAQGLAADPVRRWPPRPPARQRR